MAISWSPDPDDMDVVDLTEEITYLRLAPDGTETEYGPWQTWDNILALAQDGTTESVADPGAQMTPQATTWHIKANDLDFKPARGDRIIAYSTANAGTWLVEKCDVMTYSTRYVVETRKLLS